MIDETKQRLYVVMNVHRSVNIEDVRTGLTESHKISGLAGYLPVYETIEEAYANTNDGDLQIFTITID